MNCKPNDLAVVTGCPIADCNDQVVEVVSLYGPLREFGLAWNCTNSRIREAGFPLMPIPDAMLRPISGLPVHGEQIDEVTA
ncbi:hypothetical protein ADM96_20265 [Burkholderia sp. ST111]|nr:hypothetical protein ADM96_20265 [Burkholderia sp. ST111]